MPLMAANRVMRDHPIGSEFRGFERKFPCRWLGMSRDFASLERVYWYWVGFASSFKPQVSRTNLKDQQDNIQVNNVIDVPAIGGAYSDSGTSK